MHKCSLFHLRYNKLPQECTLQELTQYREELKIALEKRQGEGTCKGFFTNYVPGTFAGNIYLIPIKQIDEEMKRRAEQERTKDVKSVMMPISA